MEIQRTRSYSHNLELPDKSQKLPVGPDWPLKLGRCQFSTTNILHCVLEEGRGLPMTPVRLRRFHHRLMRPFPHVL